MIDRFGKVIIYVNDPKAVADFWVDKIGFTKIKVEMHETGILSVELTPNNTSDASIVLFDRSIVKKMSPEINLGTPSILFSSYDIREMRNNLISNGVKVGEFMEVGDSLTFNFSDIEDNYFAVQEIKKARKI
jgi:lactoylglutathione lyase